jgi:hypothetical protein
VSTARLPTDWVVAGRGIPTVCARHGQTAVIYHRLALPPARPQWWLMPVLEPRYTIVVHIYHAVLAKLGGAIVAPAWPFCVRCVGYRSRLRAAGSTLCGFGLAALMEAVVLHLVSGTPAGLALVGLVLTLAGGTVVGESRWPVMSRAYVTSDRRWVHVSAVEPFNQMALALQGGSWIGFPQ